MDQKIVLAALALMAGPWIGACMPDSPRTQLDWGVNTTMPHRALAATGAKTYVYADKDGSSQAGFAAKEAAPKSVPHAVVTSQPLAAVDAPAFAWPVNGRVIVDFGASDTGGKNDGINIQAPLGAPIRASASGTVTYAGNELKNYGNLVLVKHIGGFTTAYAHADRLTVSRGDVVTKGQVIGYVGQSGDVSSPQLHFEIREQTTPVNPRMYLSSSTASNTR